MSPSPRGPEIVFGKRHLIGVDLIDDDVGLLLHSDQQLANLWIAEGCAGGIFQKPGSPVCDARPSLTAQR